MRLRRSINTIQGHNVKKAFILALALFSLSAHADELTHKDIFGKWLILKDNTGEKEYWIFHDKHIEFTNGRNQKRPDPETYRIEGTNIVYGAEPYEFTIKVTSFSDTEMETNFYGFIQKLKKIE
jgi:hypothetical protein